MEFDKTELRKLNCALLQQFLNELREYQAAANSGEGVPLSIIKKTEQLEEKILEFMDIGREYYNYAMMKMVP
jgi:hypothetical protein